jgi:hypothetical protein
MLYTTMKHSNSAPKLIKPRVNPTLSPDSALLIMPKTLTPELEEDEQLTNQLWRRLLNKLLSMLKRER